MMLKLGHAHANAEHAKVAEILREFSELYIKVKDMSHSVLVPVTDTIEAEGRNTSKHIMVLFFY